MGGFSFPMMSDLCRVVSLGTVIVQKQNKRLRNSDLHGKLPNTPHMNAIKDHYTNLVIGFGKGGKTLASWLSVAGEEVALIEKSKSRYGGTCINVACIPSKSLIVNAEKGMPYEKAHSTKDELITALRKKNYDKIADAPHATVIDGTASFLSENRINVTAGGEEKTITADRIFINTGTKPFYRTSKARRANIYTPAPP